MINLEVFVLVDKLGQYYKECRDNKLPQTTRHIQEAKWFVHGDFNLEGFTTTKVKIEEV